MKMGMFLVAMRRPDRFRVFHADRLEGGSRSRLHLLPARLFTNPPGEREMHGILLAPLGPAHLIQRVEFHNAGGERGAVPGVDIEAKVLATEPGNPGFFVRCQIVVTGPPALTQHVFAEPCHAATDDGSRNHRRITRSMVSTRRSITMLSSPSRRISPVWFATRAS